MNRRVLCCVSLALLVWLPGCRGETAAESGEQRGAPVTFPAFAAAAVVDHARVLSSDAFEGRAPGTKGEDLTVAYIADQFRKAGLKPGSADGSYYQQVPLVGITPVTGAKLVFSTGTKTRELAFRDDFVAWSKHVASSAGIARSEMVFVGYGVQAPEFAWDDFKGMDVRGKTLVVLIGDPPVPDPADPQKLDAKVFGGTAMTYYGRWPYKYEIGAKLGAAAVLIVHETAPAGYAFSVVQGKTREQFELVAADKNMSRASIEGWLPIEQATALFEMAGLDFGRLKQQAVNRAFVPVPLGVTATITLQNTLRTVNSRNVIGVLEGGDPVLRNECVVYTAHWDHLGVGVAVDGDRIYHGAVDNAVAVGGLIEIARAFVASPVRPGRTLVFVSVTAEEQLMLGSTYYAQQPHLPLDRTLANINLEGLNVHGRTRDLTVIGLGNSDLDDYAREAAAAQGRVLRPDPEPEKGMYYRSDHFSFAKMGVPALEPDAGIDFVGRPAGYGQRLRDDYIARKYHKPADRVEDDWDLSGGVEDLQLYWMVGFRVAQAEKWPEWKPGTEFKARRDAQLARRAPGAR